jgi:hypothetical protein
VDVRAGPEAKTCWWIANNAFPLVSSGDPHGLDRSRRPVEAGPLGGPTRPSGLPAELPRTEKDAGIPEIERGPKPADKGEADEHLSGPRPRERFRYAHLHVKRPGRPHPHPLQPMQVYLDVVATDNTERPRRQPVAGVEPKQTRDERRHDAQRGPGIDHRVHVNGAREGADGHVPHQHHVLYLMV